MSNLSNNSSYNPRYNTSWSSPPVTNSTSMRNFYNDYTTRSKFNSSLGHLPLIMAIKYSEEGRAENLTKSGVNINEVDEQGNTALHWAVRNVNENMTDLLLQNGANANAADNKKRTPLHYIAFAPYDQNITLNSIARLLIKYGANTTATDEDKRTTLHLAIIKGKVNLAYYLIGSGTFLDCVDNDNRTPLYYAAESGYDGLVETLIKNGAVIKLGTSPLLAAVQNHNKNIENLLFKNGATITPDLYQYNITTNWTDFYTNTNDTLLGNSSSSYNPNNTLNHWQVLNSTNSTGSQAYNSTEFLSILSAIRLGEETRAENLINRGANVNEVDGRGRTALHLAAQDVNIRIIGLLIKNGANVNAVDHDRNTPLHYLASGSSDGRVSLFIAKSLIENGANSSIVDADQRTALQLATIKGNEGLANFLVKNSVNLDHSDKDSKTALYYAAERGTESIVSSLLTHGASVYVGKTPLLTAIKNNHEDVAELLSRYGATLTPANINELIVSLYLLVKGGHSC